MGSDTGDSVGDRIAVSRRPCESRKIPCKVPSKIHKAEREKVKRDHMNELFLGLGEALGKVINTGLDHPNNGKASILKETIRLLGEMIAQVDSLKKENAALSFESNYIETEKKELVDDNSALRAQIKTLQSEIEVRVHCPNLDVPPPHSNTAAQLPEASVESMSTAVMGPLYIMPLHGDSQSYPNSCTESILPMVPSNVSRPLPRYPSSSDSWPSHILDKQINVTEDV